MPTIILLEEDLESLIPFREFIKTLDAKAKKDFEIFIRGYIFGKTTA